MFSWFLPLPPPATLGALEFSLLYDQDNSSLHCTIIKAKVGEGAKLGTTRATLAFLGGLGRKQITRLLFVALSLCFSDSDEKRQKLATVNILGGGLPLGRDLEEFHLTAAASQEWSSRASRAEPRSQGDLGGASREA